MNDARWADGLILLFGVWLIFSPFLGFGDVTPAAAWNSWIVGAVVVSVSLIGLSRPEPWEEWINLAAGVWLFLAPFLFGYSGIAEATWNQVLVGGIIAVIAALGLSQRRAPTPAEPAP